MSIEETERAIRELDAVKNFGAQKEQLEKALTDKATLAEELKKCSTKLEDEKTKSEAMRKEKERCDEVGKAQEQELEKERQKTSDLTGKLEELENLRSTWDGRTLTEVIAFEQKAREDEIMRKSEEQSKAVIDGWEKNEKPRQLREAAVSELRRILEVLRTSEPHDFQAVGADLETAKIVSDLLAVRIKERAEVEFLNRSGEVARRMTKSMYDRDKKEVWSKYLEVQVGPRLQTLEILIKSHFREFIAGEFVVPCDKCKSANQFNLTSAGVEQLMKQGYLMVECSSEACRGRFGGHSIRVSLRDFIKVRVGLEDAPPG